MRGLTILSGFLVVTAAVLVRPANGGEVRATAKQSIAGGGVTVAVTSLKGQAEAPTFQIVLDTHSANLDGYRFEEIVRLRDGRGGEVAPIAVEGAKGSGHHREATVRFSKPEPEMPELELVVKGVAGVPERVFRWPVR